MGEELTKLVELAVACGRAGRTIASIGGMLTSKEQELIQEIYSRLSKREIISGSPTTAIITRKPGRKRHISKSAAYDWFTETYKTWSIPLQKKAKETLPPLTKTILAYGLSGEEDLSDEFYIDVISDVANMLREQADGLYYEFLRPQMNSFDELSGLIETEIKEKKK